MNIFSLLSFVLFMTYLLVGAYTLYTNPRARLNLVFSLLCLSFGLWALGYVVAHQTHDVSTYWIGYRIGAPGWSVSTSLFLHFFLLLTGRRRFLSRWWACVLLYAPAAFFAVKNIAEGPFLTTVVTRTALGWNEVINLDSPCTWIFFAYYAGFTLTGLGLAAMWSVRAPRDRERRQARFISVTGFIAVGMVALLEFVLPALKVLELPMRSQLPVFYWIMCIAYAMYRYRLMRVTPAAAADEILRTMMNALIILDGSGTIQTANRAAEKLLGADEGKLIGKSLLELVPGVGMFDSGQFVTRLKTSPIENSEFSFENVKGRKLRVNLCASTIRDGDGEVIGIVTVLQDITELFRTRQELDFLAHHDALTDLPNRLLLGDRLEQALIRARRYRQIVGVMLLDLDRFKDVNDTLGHPTGDRLLKAVAERLKEAIRMSDTVGRMGGDEFCFVLPDLEKPQDSAVIAHRILDSFVRPFEIEKEHLTIGASIGISLFPVDGDDGETLMKNADISMYRAKRSGGNTYQFFADSLSAIAEKRKSLEQDLGDALAKQEFVLYYQPQVSLLTGRIVGAEALLRWNHPTMGLLPPLRFLPLAEETGLIIPIGEWVIEQACRQNLAWKDEGLTPIRVSANLSTRQFRDRKLVESVERVLASTGMEPRFLELEVAEETAVKNADMSADTLRQLRGLGVRVAIDGFGTAMAFFSYLKTFPLNTLKIGRTFIQDVTSNLNNASVVASITTLAHSFNLEVIVAEGLETGEQLEFCRSVGCDVVQGFFYSRPVPPEEFKALLEKHRDPEFKL
jgi:diguanylate cyclase (GGDEF)-like protein/PAS domain S-box-containing protein